MLYSPEHSSAVRGSILEFKQKLGRYVMLRTYEGTLKGNQIDWSGDAPASERALRVHVTVLDERDPDKNRGRRMAEALERLAESGVFGSINDPSEWQRKVREERTLPGREAG